MLSNDRRKANRCCFCLRILETYHIKLGVLQVSVNSQNVVCLVGSLSKEKSEKGTFYKRKTFVFVNRYRVVVPNMMLPVSEMPRIFVEDWFSEPQLSAMIKILRNMSLFGFLIQNCTNVLQSTCKP